jgi:hypothetical protein
MNMIREWIIFALCIGLGGHVALGVLLHAPDVWTTRDAAFAGLAAGAAVYAVVQVGQSLWRMTRGRAKGDAAASRGEVG